MKLYEFRLVGHDRPFATQELTEEPVAGGAVNVAGVLYAVEGVDPTHWGQPVVVYVYSADNQ